MRSLRTNPALLYFLCALCTAFLSFVQTPEASSQTQADWRQRWDKTLNAAKKEGRVVVWGPPGELIRQAMTREFNKAYPDITVEYSGARGGEQAVRIKAERDGGVHSVDVLLSGTTTAMIQMKPIGALDPIEPALIDVSMLSDSELEWLNNYHAEVLAKIGPQVKGEDKAWLERQCAPLSR